MKIRYAKTEDAKILGELGAETFWDAYRTESNLEKQHIKAYITQAFSQKTIEQEIIDDNILFLLAENSEDQIGYSKLLLESTRSGVSGKNPLEISRIYLKKKYWGKNLGSILLAKCIKEANNNKNDVVWLSVWQHNLRAIRFYEKFGFKKVGTHTFNLASSPQIDLIMERSVKKNMMAKTEN